MARTSVDFLKSFTLHRDFTPFTSLISLHISCVFSFSPANVQFLQIHIFTPVTLLHQSRVRFPLVRFNLSINYKIYFLYIITNDINNVQNYGSTKLWDCGLCNDTYAPQPVVYLDDPVCQCDVAKRLYVAKYPNAGMWLIYFIYFYFIILFHFIFYFILLYFIRLFSIFS